MDDDGRRMHTAAKLCVLVLVVLAAAAPLLGVLWGGSCRQPLVQAVRVPPLLSRPDEQPAAAAAHPVVVHYQPGAAAPTAVTPDVARQVLAQEKLGKGRKVIAMSLFGNSSRYNQGVIENAMLARRDWPGWTLRVWHGAGVPQDTLRILQVLGAETISMEAAGAHQQTSRVCMYWRFRAALDNTTTRFIVRDADARLSQRDAAAMREWMASGRLFHTMHDHSAHSVPILGGMWGSVSGFLPRSLVQDWIDSGDASTRKYANDQAWLESVVWPLVRSEALDHSSFLCHSFGAAEWRGFPTQRADVHDFVGNVYLRKDGWIGMRVPPVCPAACRRQPEMWESC